MTDLTTNLSNNDLARIVGTVLESVRDGESGRANVWLGPIEQYTDTAGISAWVCVRGRKDGKIVLEFNAAGVATVYVYGEDGAFDTYVIGKVSLRHVEATAFEIYRIATTTR